MFAVLTRTQEHWEDNWDNGNGIKGKYLTSEELAERITAGKKLTYDYKSMSKPVDSLDDAKALKRASEINDTSDCISSTRIVTRTIFELKEVA